MDKNSELICNMCGRKLLVEHGIPREDYISVDKSWGYFSDKDGITQQFIICEKCSDRLVGMFKVPVTLKDTVEML